MFNRLIFALVFACIFAACGGDSSSSSVSPDPRPCEDQNEDCDDTSSSSGEVSKNSSSSQKNSNKEKSSSSVEKSKSSSSSKKDENSSSSEEKARESSSSVKPSSSDAKSSSSENVKPSSSSAVSSSSANSSSSAKAVMGGPCEKNGLKKIIGGVHAECIDGIWAPYVAPSSSSIAKSSSSSRGYDTLPSPLRRNTGLSYGEFTDTRDGTKYATIDIDNKYGPDSVHLAFTVFAQNLKYHDKMVLGSEEQDDDTKVEMYCYNDSIEYCNDWWGGLYQWAEMMALPYECNSKSCADLVDPDGDGFHQGICPNGWHVMKKAEVLAASYTTGGDEYLETRMSTIASEISYSNGFGRNTSGMSFLAAGYRNHKYDDDHAVFDLLNDLTILNFPEEHSSKIDRCAGGGVSNASSFNAASYKKDGASVRCVKDY